MNKVIIGQIMAALKESDLDGHYPVFQCLEKNLEEMVANLLALREEFSKRDLIPVVRIKDSAGEPIDENEQQIIEMLPDILTGFVLLAGDLAKSSGPTQESVIRCFVRAGMFTAQGMKKEDLGEFLKQKFANCLLDDLKDRTV